MDRQIDRQIEGRYHRPQIMEAFGNQFFLFSTTSPLLFLLSLIFSLLPTSFFYLFLPSFSFPYSFSSFQ